MHPYQVDEAIRVRVFWICAVAAVAAAFLLSRVVELFGNQLWFIDLPSVMGFFWLCLGFYDSYLWKTRFFQWAAWFCVPNLNGTWDCDIHSSHDGFERHLAATVVITQTGSRICIALETDESESASVSAALLRSDTHRPFKLVYDYLNKPKANAVQSMAIHEEAAWLRVKNGSSELNGEYFSGRGRAKFGHLTLSKRPAEQAYDRTVVADQ